jgi:drug/metabolite transporter (DMT)-like permease
LYDNTAKVGLGLWNQPALAFGLEAALLFGGMSLFLRGRPGRKTGMMIFAIIMLAIQAVVFFGPPPASDSAAAITALLAYGLFAAFVARWEGRHRATWQAASASE